MPEALIRNHFGWWVCAKKKSLQTWRFGESPVMSNEGSCQIRRKAERRNYSSDEGGCLWEICAFGSHWTKVAEETPTMLLSLEPASSDRLEEGGGIGSEGRKWKKKGNWEPGWCYEWHIEDSDRLVDVTYLSCSAGDVIFLARAIISALCQVNISSRSLRGAYWPSEMFFDNDQMATFSGDPDYNREIVCL